MATVLQTANDSLAKLTEHSWKPQPAPARVVHQLLNECLQQSPFGAALSQRMLAETGTRLLDWIDHFGIPHVDPMLGELPGVGYVETKSDGGEAVWHHPEGLFPRIRVIDGKRRELAIKVESVADFLFAHEMTDVAIEGEPWSALRRARVASDAGVDVIVVERHGTLAFEPSAADSLITALVALHYERFLLRRRDFEQDAEGFAAAGELADAAMKDLGRDRACELFFKAERQYWQQRNRAGRIQLARQAVLGLGWANHDHHTYRSSRETFVLLIAFLEKLGFVCRERFYAGREAGWGAQVIEHPVTGVTIFADVDLSPEELAQDFSHEPLPARAQLGTVGLWCALHGEAFLQAGMHHLECQFDFSATRDQLKEAGIDTMPPFTDFPYLRQAFTRGEQWKVRPERVERLRAAGRITDAQANQFLSQGALGSHLEILQRDDGYKGFNQTGINEIISATDPRRSLHQ
ncbi:hypothetical protein [Schlesneria sp.]|uniref:hypothetical protein n=1 Tax=Schlesneria sp. TaxID=2762018 RepID=UPI002EF0D507